MVWKLYCDSRKRVRNARGDTDSDFAIALPRPINVSGKCWIDSFLCGNSFYTCRAGECDRFYIDELASPVKRTCILAAGQYTVYQLRDALVTALNTNRLITGQYAVTYTPGINRLEISITNPTLPHDVFRVWPEELMQADAAAWGLTPESLHSANYALGFFGVAHLLNGPVVTGLKAPDVQPYYQLFLRSNLGGASSESLGPNFESDIVRRIVVGNVPQNSIIHDVQSSTVDCIRINGIMEFSQFWFELIDFNGKVVNTHGMPISFSICFADIDD